MAGMRYPFVKLNYCIRGRCEVLLENGKYAYLSAGMLSIDSNHLIAEKPPAKKSGIIRKLTAILIYAVMFALVLRFINGITTFSDAAVATYLLWLVVDWYDCLVVDILMAPFDKFYRMVKVSPVEKSAVWFHCKGSLRGMIIGLVFAPVVGLIVMLL